MENFANEFFGKVSRNGKLCTSWYHGKLDNIQI
jgi:hypothetical protein